MKYRISGIIVVIIFFLFGISAVEAEVVNKKRAAQLTLNQLGKHFIVGLEGSTISETEKKYLAELQPSGIIIFRRNFSPDDQWRLNLNKLIESAKSASQNSIKIISIDFEGGKINRFPQEIKRFPYQQEWSDSVFNTSKEMASILNDLGFNLTYGPVADLDFKIGRSPIGKRAFSSDKNLVASSCEAYVDAYKEMDILTCAKHFPGHGRTLLDSHIALPKVECSSKKLLDDDLFPFTKLIKRKIPFIMLAHVLYTCLDPIYPATLSKKIQTDLLRVKLKFKGLIISDDMNMKALANYSGTERIRIAIEAGTDFLLFGKEMEKRGIETSYQIANKFISLDINENVLKTLKLSATRIDKMFAELQLH